MTTNEMTMKRVNPTKSQKRWWGPATVAILLLGGMGWFIFRPNVCEYMYENRHAMTTDKKASRFGYMSVGTPESPFGYDIDYFIILRDGSLFDLSNPDVPLLISKCGAGVPAISGGRAGARWPDGALYYQNSPYREFVVSGGRLLSFTVMVDPSGSERVEFGSRAGIRYSLPLSREEMLTVLGRGGAFRSFLRE